MPAQAALFAAPLLLLGYALFGTSRQLMVGATSASAIMLASTVAGLVGNTGTRYTSFVLGLTLLIALIMLANVHGPVHDLFERSKQASVFGEQQLFDSVEEGVEYFTSSLSRSS